MIRGLVLSRLLMLAAACALAIAPSPAAGQSLSRTVAATQPKMVKIYGAGGLRALEPYQSGFLISPEGHVLTVWSYVLDTDYIMCTLDDGRRFPAELVGLDPRLEVAVIKIDVSELPYFNLAEGISAEPLTRVLAFSNLFGVATGDESTSVQRGVIATRARLDARRGVFETPYHGQVYVLDAMTNNPGAAGGALVNLEGQLLGILGKELRNAQNNIWLNYAMPIDEVRSSVEQILAGKVRSGDDVPEALPDNPADLAELGIVLVPDILERTPPYVDIVRAGSPAAAAGIKPDDLVIFMGDNLVHSCKGLRDELARVENTRPIKLVLMRDHELVEVVVDPAGKASPKSSSEEDTK